MKTIRNTITKIAAAAMTMFVGTAATHAVDCTLELFRETSSGTSSMTDILPFGSGHTEDAADLRRAGCESLNPQGNSPITGGTARPLSSPDGDAMAALAGHWRCTTFLGGGDLNITTDHHIILNPNGTYRLWRYSTNSFRGSGSASAPETGRWAVRGGSFLFTDARGEMAIVPFRWDGATIVLPNDHRRVWERVR